MILSLGKDALPRGTLLCLLLISALAGLWGCEGCSGRSAVNQLPKLEDLNIILMVVDSLGVEHVGAYADGLDVSPNIDRMAREGVLFKNMIATAPWTKPTVSSLLTGLMPSAHQVKPLESKLPSEITTLPEFLKPRGFDSIGIVSHVLLGEKYGFSQGFDDYNQLNSDRPNTTITSERISGAAIQWLNDRQKSGENDHFFMFLHYFDPHYNYQHHKEFDRTSEYGGEIKPGLHIRKLRAMRQELVPDDIEYLINLHREEIAFTDYHIGRVLDHVKELGIEKETLIIFVADHGEEFMRHGWIGHTRTLYDELIHVPFIMYLPGVLKPRVVEAGVSQVDLVPTLLGMSRDAPKANIWQGESLQPYLVGNEVAGKRDFFSEVDVKSDDPEKNANLTAVVRGPLKLIHDRNKKKYELYDRSKDPEELRNVAGDMPDLVKELTEVLKNWEMSFENMEQKVKPQESLMNEEEVEQLKSLGYM